MLGWRVYVMPQDGIARGYLNTAFYIYDALKRQGGIVPVVADARTAATTVLHVCPPSFFRPVPDAVNVLFSMWETDRIPRVELEVFRSADRMIVPSRYCQEVFAGHGVLADVVPLGVHPAYFRVPEREGWHARQNLAFLSLGAPSRRKGLHLLVPAWKEAWVKRRPTYDPFLYVKTINEIHEVRAYCGGRVVFDTRDLAPDVVLGLYARSDVFVFPSMGEGFGLPALEAMAAGCLVIAPQSSGLTEFVSPETAIVIKRTQRTTVDYGIAFEAFVPSRDDLADALVSLYDRLGSMELEEIRTNGREKARSLTWDNTAQKILSLYPTQ